MKFLLDVNKLVLGHNELIAQVTHIAGTRQILIQVQSITHELLATTVEVVDQLHDQLVRDQLANLLPGEEKTAQFAHRLVYLLFVLDVNLLSSPDVPDTAQRHTLDLLDVVEIVQSVGAKDEVDDHLGDLDSFGGLQVVDDGFGHGFDLAQGFPLDLRHDDEIVLVEIDHVVMQLLVLLLDDLLVESFLVDGLVGIVGLGSSYFLRHVEEPQYVRGAGVGLHKSDCELVLVLGHDARIQLGRQVDVEVGSAAVGAAGQHRGENVARPVGQGFLDEIVKVHFVSDFDRACLGDNLNESVVDQEEGLSNVKMKHRQVGLVLTPLLNLDDGLEEEDAGLNLLDGVVLVGQEGVGIFMHGAIEMLGLLGRIRQQAIASCFGGVKAGEFAAGVVVLGILQVNISNVSSSFHFYLLFRLYTQPLCDRLLVFTLKYMHKLNRHLQRTAQKLSSSLFGPTGAGKTKAALNNLQNSKADLFYIGEVNHWSMVEQIIYHFQPCQE